MVENTLQKERILMILMRRFINPTPNVRKICTVQLKPCEDIWTNIRRTATETVELTATTMLEFTSVVQDPAVTPALMILLFTKHFRSVMLKFGQIKDGNNQRIS